MTRAAAALSRTTSRGGPALPCKNFFDQGCVPGGVTPGQRAQRRLLQTCIAGFQGEVADGMVPYLGYFAYPVQGEFVQSISSMDHKGMAHTQPSQAVGHQVHPGENPDDLCSGTGGVGQRPGQIEDGAETERPANRLHPL